MDRSVSPLRGRSDRPGHPHLQDQRRPARSRVTSGRVHTGTTAPPAAGSHVLSSWRWRMSPPSDHAGIRPRAAGEAVTGLLDAWGEDAEPLGSRIRPKILLREDVFASVSPANVNRWRTRDVELRWDFNELIACLSNRAKQDPQLQTYIEREREKLLGALDLQVAEFVVLFDERVRPREKQARTWLTVQNRLTDALGNRFPRDFLRFGVEALKLELAEPGIRRRFLLPLSPGHARGERRAVDLGMSFLTHWPPGSEGALRH